MASEDRLAARACVLMVGLTLVYSLFILGCASSDRILHDGKPVVQPTRPLPDLLLARKDSIIIRDRPFLMSHFTMGDTMDIFVTRISGLLVHAEARHVDGWCLIATSTRSGVKWQEAWCIPYWRVRSIFDQAVKDFRARKKGAKHLKASAWAGGPLSFWEQNQRR